MVIFNQTGQKVKNKYFEYEGKHYQLFKGKFYDENHKRVDEELATKIKQYYVNKGWRLYA